MKLIIPTNWDKGLIKEAAYLKNVFEFYGKMDSDIFGGGRPADILPTVKKNKIKEYVALMHEYGLEFNYLLNTACLGNIEWSRPWQKKARLMLDWLAEINVDTLTVAVPYLLQLIKRHYPKFKVSVSVYAAVSTPLQARYWEDLGADGINLSHHLVNRDFKVLQEIRAAVKTSLQLIANLRCLKDCPFRFYHQNANSHASNSAFKSGSFYMRYCFVSCNYLQLSEPWRIISSNWIRPEDLHYYSKIGIDCIKLVDRAMSTSHILRIARAYSEERYDGNLMDLFFSFSKRLEKTGQGAGKGNSGLSNKKVETNNYLKSLMEEEGVFIENRSLDGFIKFFVNNKCDHSNCYKCSYCKSAANKFVIIPKKHRNKVIAGCERYLNKVINTGLA